MDWLSRVQKQAQEAAEKLIGSEAAEKARQLATQATQQAAALAQQATVKAQEVAKEAIGEAEKSISAFRHKGVEGSSPSPDPAQFGITQELERFVCSLTYSTFSEYPQDSLDVPSAPEQQRLTSWQETHARLVLQRVQPLQDLRFVLCPKRMDEYMFWLIYFTLCKRYLPNPEQQQEAAQPPAEGSHVPAAAPATSAGTATATAAAAAAAGSSTSIGGVDAAESHPAAAAAAGSPSAAAAEPAPGGGASGSGAGASAGEGGTTDDLGELADDPELSAYLQGALQLDSKAADADSGELGSDVDDLDDYLTALDAEVNAPK